MLKILGNPNPDSEGVLFGNITLEQLEKTKPCTIPRLQAFIHARSWSGAKPHGAANWPKRKGKASDGERSYISWAYEMRNSPVVLDVPDEIVDFEMLDDVGASAPPPTVEYMGVQESFSLPSVHLSDDLWVGMVCESFQASFQDVSDETKQQADELYSRLNQNLASHIQKKVDERKRRHFTLNWFRQNLSQFAAIVTLAGHVRDEPSMVGERECLLRNPVGSNHRFILIDANVDTNTELWYAEGCYLYYDTLNGEWIRSGKVAGTQHDSKGIMDRHKEHMRSAARNDESSGLYVKYPAKTSRVATTV